MQSQLLKFIVRFLAHLIVLFAKLGCSRFGSSGFRLGSSGSTLSFSYFAYKLGLGTFGSDQPRQYGPDKQSTNGPYNVFHETYLDLDGRFRSSVKILGSNIDFVPSLTRSRSR